MTKKDFIARALAGCLLLAAFSSSAVADDSGAYLAADLGQSRFSGDAFAFPGSGWMSSSQSDSSAYRLTAGYQLTPYFGLEAGYVDLGHGSVTLRPTPSSPPIGFNMLGFRAGVKGEFAAITGTWPIDPQWALFARLGGIEGKLDFQTTQSNVPGTFDRTSTAWTSTYGVGAKWNFQPQWSLRLGWDHYHSVGNASVEVSLLSLGVEWHFL